MRKLFGFLFVIATFVCVLSCNVGLGESVDTEPPTVSVLYPPESSIIRDSFILSGKTEDDKEVKEVQIIVKEINGNDAKPVQTHVVKPTDDVWQVELNAKSESSYPLKDGKYTVDITSTDTAGRVSGISSRTFEIDNTAPVFVIKSPGITNIESATPYGSIFKVVGTIADDHEIETMTVNIKDETGKELVVWTEENVDTAGGTEVVFARYNKDAADGADVYNDRYLQIYGKETTGDKAFLCTISVADKARTYKNPDDLTKSEGGNSTEGLYLNDDIYDELMGKNSKYKLTASDFKKILNGTYDSSKVASSENQIEQSKTPENKVEQNQNSIDISDAQLAEIKELLSKYLTDTKATALAFKLNKNANPTYDVTGFSFTGTNASVNAASKNGKVTFRALAGLDGTYFNPKTIKVYLFGPFDSVDEELLNSIYENPTAYYDKAIADAKQQLGQNASEELIDAASGARVIFDGKDYNGQTVDDYSTSIELPSVITTGRSYIFAATGQDIDGLEFLSNGYYGFVGKSAGFPPTVTIDSPVDQSLSQQLSLIKGKVESSESNIDRVEYKITVLDEGNNSKEVGTITGVAVSKDGTFDSQEENYEIDLSKGTEEVSEGYTTCLPVEGCMYKYDILISGIDVTGLKGSASQSIKIDTKKPEIAINSVLPVAATEELPSETINIVNGTITISGNITEANFNSAKVIVSDGTKSEEAVFTTTYFTKEVDTTKFADKSALTITVVATDKAANESTLVNTQYKIDQATDIPQIASSNALNSTELEGKWSNIQNGTNLFGVKQNNSISFNITDDDGVNTVEVGLYESDETTKISFETKEAKGVTSYPVTLKLPETFGDYKVTIAVKDVKYTEETKANRSSSQEYYVSVNESGLTMHINDGGNIEVRADKAKTVSGTASVSLEHLASIKKYELVYDDAEKIWNIPENAVEVAKYPYDAQADAGKAQITVAEENSICKWTEEYAITVFQSASEKHFAYVATDIYGNKAQSDLHISIDDKVPTIKSISNIDGWKNTRTQTISVVVGDNSGTFNSGIDTVKCKIGSNEYELVADKICDVNGNVVENGTYRIYKTTLDLPNEGNNSVSVTVFDKVGYTNSTTFAYNIDTISPTDTTVSIVANQVLNESKSLAITYSSKDATGGIKSIKIGTKNNLSGAVQIDGENAKDIASKVYNFALSSFADGEYKIYLQAEDVAGNKTDVIEATSAFIVDSTNPTVKITSPVSNSVVNKAVTFVGTVQDSNIADSAKPVLEYSTNGTSWTAITTATLDGQSWTITDVDTTKIHNTTAAKDVNFRVKFTDKAANLGTSADYKLTIDQNADRPEIKLTNINISASAISSNKVMGVISDDDGDVSKLYRIATSKYTDGLVPNGSNAWKEIKVEKGTGIWTAELSNDETEGAQSWYFYVIDSKGGKFCTKDSSQLNRMYLSDSVSSKTDNTTGIAFTYDITPPAIEIKAAHGTADAVENWDDKDNIFGGEQYIWIKAIVKESVGMNANPVAITVTGATPTVKSTTTEGTTYEYTFTPVKASSLAEGTVQISVTAKDSSGLENKNMTNVIVDKTAPVVKVISPTTALSDAVSSAISVKGIIQDNYSSIKKLQWAIPKKSTQNDEHEWKDVGTAASWEIKFASGAPDSSDSLVYYANAKDAGGEDVYNISKHGTENIFKVPMYFKATDSCGNEAIIKDQYVLVDSDGGKPKAWINSPENGATTSGLVTIYGGASDNVSVSKVCIQIDANNDGNFDENDINSMSTWTSQDLEAGSLFPSSGNGKNDWYILASGTNSWKLSINSALIPTVNSKTYLRIRVRAVDDEGLSRGYSDPITVTIDSQTPTIKNLKVVQYGTSEAKPTADSVPIAEREYIAGMYISDVSVATNGKWFLVGDIQDNESIATVSFTKIESTTTNTINLNVQDEHPNKGDYKLLIPLETNQSGVISYAIKAIDANHAETTSNITINIDSSAPSLYTTNNSESLNVGDKLRLKSVGKVIGTGDANGTVVNNNNFFTFGDVVSEGGSGLAYLAFYFERNGSSERRIYNPMTETNNKTVISSKSSTNGATYINDDGLAVMYVDNSRYSDDAITISSANANVRKGGLIKIAGGYSQITEVITEVNETTVIKFSPTASTSFTTAEIVLAQVVDHQIIESLSDDNSVMNDDGDEMVETIQLIGSSYNWTASVDSTNIPDGPITIHVVAIDNAGNISQGSIATRVENNRPRIAKVLLATDLNDNNFYDWNANSAPVTTGDDEKDTKDGKAFGEFSYYSALNPNSGKAQSEVTLNSNAFKVIDGLCIIPEFVGGNTELGYILEYPANLAAATKKTGAVTAMNTNIKTYTNNVGKYSITDEITNFGGIVLNSITSGNISLTFWDKTEETTQGTNSQWALLKIPVTNLTEDEVVPEPKITPFYWNSSTDNSVYIDGGIKGHIELENDLPNDTFKAANVSGVNDRDPKVSGKIKLEGIVYDNVRLRTITIYAFGKSGTVGTYSGGEWTQSASLPTGVISFAAEDIELSQNGHYAKYEMVIDTETLTSVAGKNQIISVGATDWKSNSCATVTSSTGTQTIGKTQEINGKIYNTGTTNYYRMDVVPYVTSIWTELSEYDRNNPSVYARSSIGKYPVRVGENITVYGWNLNYTTRSVKLNGTTVSGTSVSANLNENVKQGTYGINMTITEDHSSGALEVTVNGVSALNNINKDNAKGAYTGDISDKDATGKEYAHGYNRRPNGINNNVLTDDIALDVWDFKVAAQPEGSSAKYVHMKVGPYIPGDANNARIGFSFKNGIGYYNMAGKACDVSGDVIKLRIHKDSVPKTHIHMWKPSGGDVTTWPGSRISDWPLEDGYYVYTVNASKIGYKLNNNKENAGADQFEVSSSGVWDYNTSKSKFEENTNISITSNVSATTVFSHTRMGSNFGGFTSNTFTFDALGHSYGVAMCPDTSGKAGIAANLQFFSRATGSNDTASSVDLNFNYKNVNNARRIENICYYKDGVLKTDEERIQVPSMASYVSGTTSYVYLAYYDHGLDQIKFRIGSVGSDANNIGLGLQDLNKKTGRDTGLDDNGKIGYGDSKVFDSTSSSYVGDKGNAFKNVRVISSGNEASADVAVAALNNGTAVVAYYTGKELKIQYAPFASISSNNAYNATWTTKTVSSKGGKNVAMVADAAGGLHFAYSSNSGADLYYTYMSSLTATPVTMLVDSYDNVGSYCTIDVGRTSSTSSQWIPYITYKRDASEVALKMAYPVVNVSTEKPGASSAGFFTGNWDVCTIPSANNSTNDLVNVGLCKTWSNGVIQDFPTGADDFSYNPGGTYAICNSSVIYGNGTQNPVVGYAVEQGYIEVAQKK
ncbi:MAG: Ig-like domain-containing protein [Treponema sp.]|nr:Ig-like domain-containing protein [Treponema sp.]